jgi:hypothetical protein
MAKKTNTPKNPKTTVKASESVKEVEAKTELTQPISEEFTGGELLVDIKTIEVAKLAPAPAKTFIENMSVMELVWLEKACATVCKKYETTARLDLENNKKLTEFSKYYKNILNVLEDRVREVCLLLE